MVIPMCKHLLLTGFVLSYVSAGTALAELATARNSPTVSQALGIKPLQKDVDCDQPAADEIEKCTMKAEKSAGKTGWVLRNSKGQMIRNFIDTDGDNRVDQWSYFKDGVEIYRDIDSNHNGKADQCRWLNTAGTRLGTDKNEDRVIDTWEVISPEEVSSELVAAIRDHDRPRFERLLVNAGELDALGLGPAKLEEAQKRAAAAAAGFEQFARSQKVINRQSTWVYFGGGRPGTIPQGTDDSTADITAYENVAAMVDTDGKTGQLPIANLIKIENTWKLIDLPTEAAVPLIALGPHVDKSDRRAVASSDGPSEKARDWMDRLSDLDKLPSPTLEQIKQKCDILKDLAEEAKPGEDRAGWYRQLADVLSSAAQVGTYPEGIERLKTLLEEVAAQEDKELAAFVQFRLLTAAYSQALSKGEDYAKVQEKWLADLEEFVKQHPTSVDSAEAMLQLAMGQELSGDDKNALKWYERVKQSFSKTAAANKSEGAVRRLESVGRTIPLKGKSLGGRAVDLAAAKGKAVVLIHYWSSDIDACKMDLPAIEKMVGKYGPENFVVIGVSLDNDRAGARKLSPQQPPALAQPLGRRRIEQPACQRNGNSHATHHDSGRQGRQGGRSECARDRTGRRIERHAQGAVGRPTT